MKLSRNITIACYDTDVSMSLKPASFMDYAQEIAGQQVDILGMGYDDLIKDNRAWVILRMHIIFRRHPQWRDKVVLSTWHRCMDGPFFIRDYQLRDENGELLVDSTSSWIICDLNQRKYVRILPSECSYEDYSPEDGDLLPLCKRLRMPADLSLTPSSEHVVAYSDVDKNIHSNNSKYVQWAMDALDPQFLVSHPVREVEVNFNREARLGQTVSLYTGTDSDGVIYVEGRVDGECSFLTKFIF